MSDSPLEIAKDFKNTLQERIKSPILGTFILAWIWINWEPISIFLFSDVPIEARTQYIVGVYSNSWHTIILPLIIATLYALALPFLHWGVEYVSARAFNGRNTVKADKHTAYLYTQIRVKKASVDLEIKEKQHRELLNNKGQIQDLEYQITVLQKTLSETRTSHATTSDALNKQNEDLIKVIEELGKQINKQEDKYKDLISQKDQDIRKLKSAPKVQRLLYEFKDGGKVIEIMYQLPDGMTNIFKYYDENGVAIESNEAIKRISDEKVISKSLPFEKLS